MLRVPGVKSNVEFAKVWPTCIVYMQSYDMYICLGLNSRFRMVQTHTWQDWCGEPNSEILFWTDCIFLFNTQMAKIALMGSGVWMFLVWTTFNLEPRPFGSSKDHRGTWNSSRPKWPWVPVTWRRYSGPIKDRHLFLSLEWWLRFGEPPNGCMISLVKYSKPYIYISIYIYSIP